MNFLKDIYRFISYLTFVDIIFFVAIISLLILLVTLVYFIRINKDDIDEEIFPNDNDNHKDEDKKEIMEVKKDNEVNEILNKITNYPPKDMVDIDEEEGELLDLESLTKKLKANSENNEVNITEYEKDQEEKAIISYDELLQKHNRYAINYEKEEVLDDLIVKKVNLNDLVNKSKEEETIEVRVISYKKEEAFLSALKELNSLLN